MKKAVRVLQVVIGMPSVKNPSLMPFISSQIKSLKKYGIEIDVLSLSELCENKLGKYFYGIREVRTRVYNNNYDIVHAHFSYCGWVSRCQSKVPVIVSLMGSDILGRINKRGRLSLRGKIDSWLTKFLAKFMDHIIVKSDNMAKMISQKNKVTVVPNGVDFELFRPINKNQAREYFGLELDHNVILFAANPELSNKNYPLARDSVEILKKKLSSPCLLWVVCNKSQTELALAMNAADVLIVPSFTEGSPNVVKEAMASNLPIVSVNVGDVSQVISKAINCYIADYDPVDIAEKIALVIESGNRSNGRQCIEHLRLEIVAKKILNIYESIIEKR
jgi:teichuronic acid biosynthesis glycosyltransferase TuaC